jgi:hypothetical protein
MLSPSLWIVRSSRGRNWIRKRSCWAGSPNGGCRACLPASVSQASAGRRPDQTAVFAERNDTCPTAKRPSC